MPVGRLDLRGETETGATRLDVDALDGFGVP